MNHRSRSSLSVSYGRRRDRRGRARRRHVGLDPGDYAAGVPHRVHPSPSHFTQGRVDNPWFPLKPGTRLVYRGQRGRGAHPRRA